MWRGRRRQAADQDESIADAVVRVAAGLGWAAVHAPESETLVVSGGDGPAGARIGLSPLVDMVTGHPAPADRDAVIAGYLRRAAAMAAEQAAGPPGWDAARPMLRTRVHGRATLPGDVPEDRLAARRVATDLLECLVLDLPDRIVLLDRVTVGGWPVDLDTAYDTGRAAVREHEPVEPAAIELGDGLVLVEILGSDYFCASHALWLDRVVGLPPEGALVAVPGREVVLAWPLDRARAMAGLRMLADECRVAYAESPGPVSSSVYQYRDGRLTLVAVAAAPGDPAEVTLTGDAMRL